MMRSDGTWEFNCRLILTTFCSLKIRPGIERAVHVKRSTLIMSFIPQAQAPMWIDWQKAVTNVLWCCETYPRVDNQPNPRESETRTRRLGILARPRMKAIHDRPAARKSYARARLPTHKEGNVGVEGLCGAFAQATFSSVFGACQWLMSIICSWISRRQSSLSRVLVHAG